MAQGPARQAGSDGAGRKRRPIANRAAPGSQGPAQRVEEGAAPDAEGLVLAVRIEGPVIEDVSACRTVAEDQFRPARRAEALGQGRAVADHLHLPRAERALKDLLRRFGMRRWRESEEAKGGAHRDRA